MADRGRTEAQMVIYDATRAAARAGHPVHETDERRLVLAGQRCAHCDFPKVGVVVFSFADGSTLQRGRIFGGRPAWNCL